MKKLILVLCVFMIIGFNYTTYAQNPNGNNDPNNPSGCLSPRYPEGRTCYACGLWPTCPASPCLSCWRIYKLDPNYWDPSLTGITFYNGDGSTEDVIVVSYDVLSVFDTEGNFVGYHNTFEEYSEE